MKKILGIAALALVAGTAHADYTFSTFNLVDVSQNNLWNNNGAVALTGAPAATYVGFRVNFAWNSSPAGTSSSHAWSSEARVMLASASGTATGPTFPSGTTQHTAVTSASNGAGNASSVASLNFAGALTNIYSGGAAPLFFNYRQTFTSSVNDVNWDGITVTLIEAVRPTCIDLGGISGASLNFNTEGSVISGTNDTEIAVYNNSGTLLGQDDDSGTGNLSNLNLAGLADGVYYIAVGAFNTTFSNGWGAFSSSAESGTTVVNVTNGVDTLTGGGALAAGQIQWYCITVPTPGALAVLGMGALVVGGRRRAR
jgi:hypothetical protein